MPGEARRLGIVPQETVKIAIKKRNGQEIPFFETRILKAIQSACKAEQAIPQESELKSPWSLRMEAVAEQVISWCYERAEQEPVLFIEDVQDAVVEKLRAAGWEDVAGRYSSYRREHEKKRLVNEHITVQKRDGRVVSFKPEKIAIAVGKAFAAHAGEEVLPRELQSMVLALADNVVLGLRSKDLNIRTVHKIETIQDRVETILMDEGHYDVAKKYILYREERRKARDQKPDEVEDSKASVEVRTAAGEPLVVSRPELRASLLESCQGLEDQVSTETLLHRTMANCFDGMTEAQLPEAALLAARSLIEREPAYSYVAGRLLLKSIYSEVLGRPTTLKDMASQYPMALKQSLQAAVEAERLDPRLMEFELDRLSAALDPERDFRFSYMGLQILYDRYFIHSEGRRLETPQIFWMRVAMGLALNETANSRTDRAIQFYNIISEFRFVPSTPTLFNVGTLHPQLSSCFLTTIADDLDHIFKSIKDNAMLSKWSGGLGNDWTPVRALGARIKGTNGNSQGVVPFLKVANDTAVAVNQGGKRQGAVCAYMEVWHLDIEEFLELRKNTGDDRRRTHDMHTANWIPDLFMKRVRADGDWTLFSPNETPDLHDLYGAAFEKRYEEYEAMAKIGKLRQMKTLSSVQLWRKMLSMLFETGHPWITFKDPSNVRSPQDHVGVVHSSNLCTEILLNTSREETAVCNLGSINMVEHTTPGGLNEELIAETVSIAIRMLDNVIDLNFYPTKEAKTSNTRHRPVGMGIMGFQDALYIQGFGYGSSQAVEFADESMELISYHALLASSLLAKERGTYDSYTGSKWDRGLLPIDTLELLGRERGGFLDVDLTERLDWSIVRDAIKKNGIRNSNTMAIAPTATIANIIGVSQSIEPTYKNLYVKSNLSGEFTTINPYLVEELKALNLWDAQMVEDLKYFDGSLQEISRIPQKIRSRYATAFEIGSEWLIECASRRQKWLDMGQSLNLFLAEPNGKKLHTMYDLAWEKGLKTTYYLRSLSATRIEKSTVDASKYGNPLGQTVRVDEDKNQCAIDDPDCEACQ